jgi:hypothetical protein
MMRATKQEKKTKHCEIDAPITITTRVAPASQTNSTRSTTLYCTYILDKELQLDTTEFRRVFSLPEANIEKDDGIPPLNGFHDGWIWSRR